MYFSNLMEVKITIDALVPGVTTVTATNERGDSVVTTSPIVWYVEVSQTTKNGGLSNAAIGGIIGGCYLGIILLACCSLSNLCRR
jgi:hypothetical protein